MARRALACSLTAYKPKPAYDAMLKELAAGRTLTH